VDLTFGKTLDERAEAVAGSVSNSTRNHNQIAEDPAHATASRHLWLTLLKQGGQASEKLENSLSAKISARILILVRCKKDPYMRHFKHQPHVFSFLTSKQNID